MFRGSSFLIVRSLDLPRREAEDLQNKLKEQEAAKVYIKDDFDNSVNFLDPPLVTHIVATTVEFIEYAQAQKSMIPVTNPDWVYDSLADCKLLPLKTYNPDPAFFLKNCSVCCADNLPEGDKELIYAAVKVFGGNYVDVLTKYTTHLIAMDMTNEKSMLAGSILANKLSDDPIVNIKIVYPHWLDHCITMGQKVDETKYLIPDNNNNNNNNYNINNNNTDLLDLRNAKVRCEELDLMLDDSLPQVDDTTVTNLPIDYFQNKRIYVSSDFNLSQRLSNSVRALIEKYGGIVANTFDEVDSIDVYLGRYRQSDAYYKACQSNRIIVGNLQWFYSIILKKKWILPLNSNILYYPVPAKPLKAFKDLSISITNYCGDSRNYLIKLIEYLGATFTKTLTKDNDFLICAKATGRKYEGCSNWLNSWGEPEVKIVNHLWLEDCFIQWQKLDYKDLKYTNFGGEVGMEPLIGRVCLDKKLIDKQNSIFVKCTGNSHELDKEENEAGDIADSMSEDESTQVKSPVKRSLPNAPFVPSAPLVMSSVNTLNKNETSLVVKEKQALENENQNQNQNQKGNVITIVSPVVSNKADPNEIKTAIDLVSPTTPKNNENSLGGIKVDDRNAEAMGHHRYGGRSAAKKAAAKLHDNMSDLNAYQAMSKSSRKMKHYMEELENAATKRKKPLAEAGNEEEEDNDDDDNDNEKEKEEEEDKEEDKDKDANRSRKKKKQGEDILEMKENKRQKTNECDIVAILTGCELQINLTKNDCAKLQTVGIKIVSDLTRTKPNTLVAPKILRTEKFLRSLSTVDKIIHPSFIVDVLANIENTDNVRLRYNVDDYPLDRINKETRAELGVKSLKSLLSKTNIRGHLFSNMTLNLSSELNGGINVISGILKDHGLKEFKEIKPATQFSKKKNTVLSCEFNGSTTSILIANKNKDSKLITNFKKSVSNGMVVSWDWCVRSIFTMELQDIKEFEL